MTADRLDGPAVQRLDVLIELLEEHPAAAHDVIDALIEMVTVTWRLVDEAEDQR